MFICAARQWLVGKVAVGTVLHILIPCRLCLLTQAAITTLISLKDAEGVCRGYLFLPPSRMAYRLTNVVGP